MNEDIKFLLKLVRNGGILSVLMFVSFWATKEFCWEIIKPVIIFYIGYVFTELAARYGIELKKGKTINTTLIY